MFAASIPFSFMDLMGHFSIIFLFNRLLGIFWTYSQTPVCNRNRSDQMVRRIGSRRVITMMDGYVVNSRGDPFHPLRIRFEGPLRNGLLAYKFINGGDPNYLHLLAIPGMILQVHGILPYPHTLQTHLCTRDGFLCAAPDQPTVT